MLTRVCGHNVQRHAALDLSLHPHINVITGTNNVGKSSIYRAIRWVALNDIPNTVMVTEGKSTSWVELFINSQSIRREVTATFNGYRWDANEVRAVGRAVPPRAEQDIINLSDINFQHSSDRFFFVGLSSTERYNKLMEISGLASITGLADIIDKQVRENAAKRRANTEVVEHAVKQINLIKFRSIKRILRGIREMKVLQERIADAIFARLNLLNLLNLEHGWCKGPHNTWISREFVLDELRTLVSLRLSLEQAKEEGQKLKQLEKDCAEQLAKLNDLTQRVKLLKETTTCPTCGASLEN